MSKVSFRARQIDYNRSLSIVRYDSEAFQELGEGAFINRGTPTVPSGMEREEENEHHFIEVIQALQIQKTDVCIPVPEIVDKSDDYEKMHDGNFSLPKNLIHIRMIALKEDEPVAYDMDTDDEDWLRRSDLGLSSEKFESMIDRLERGCGQRVMNLEEAKLLLSEDPSLVIAVYDYWLNKRIQGRQPLLLTVRQEKRDGGSNNDPYVAFRRRTERMQTRKNRKNDEYSYEKMLLLREQMKSLGEIVDRVQKRESTKTAAINIERRIFQLRYKLCDWEASQLSEADFVAQKSPRSLERLVNLNARKIHASRKRKISRRSPDSTCVDCSDASNVDTPNKRNDPFAFVRLPGCRYQKPLDLRNIPQLNESANSYHLSRIPPLFVNSPNPYTGYIRRRFGRGGRVIFDRLPPPSGEIEELLTQGATQTPQPESHRTILPRHTLVDNYILTRDTSMVIDPHKQVTSELHRGHPRSRNSIAKCLQLSFLRSQSSRQLAICLSRLTGRNFSSGWLGRSENSVYPPLAASPVNNLNSAHSCAVPIADTQSVSQPVSAPLPSRKHNKYPQGNSEVPLSQRGGATDGPIPDKGQPMQVGGSPTAILAATKCIKVVSSTRLPQSPLSRKVQILNGVANPQISTDDNFRWIPQHQITPVRKTASVTSLLSVTNSAVATKQPPTEENSTDGSNSIIQPVVYNV